MPKELNYQQLDELQKDINHLIETSPAFVFFLQEKIHRFLKNATYRLEVLFKTKDELRDAYVQKDPQGVAMAKEENGITVWAFENEDVKKEYLDKLNQFMSITFKLNV